MASQTLSYQEALTRARSNRTFLKILFGLSIVGALGDLRYIDGSSFSFIFLLLDALTVTLSFLLMRTCFATYAVLLFATKLSVIGFHFLSPLGGDELGSLFFYGIVGGVLNFFAFLACRRIHRYLSAIPVPPVKLPDRT